MATLAVYVSPKSAENALIGWGTTDHDKLELHVRLTAAPEGGKANEALVRLIAQHLTIPKSSITIKSGQTSRHKLLHIALEQALLDRELKRPGKPLDQKEL